MLKITIPKTEEQQLWDPVREEFIYIPAGKEVVLNLEHSLLSLHKWEQIWHKPFLKGLTTEDEIISYIECMIINSNVDPGIVKRIPSREIDRITEYINNPATATIINENSKGKNNRETLTAEVFYYLMTAYQIPFECQKWHLNSLRTLIKVCEIKNDPNAHNNKFTNKELRQNYDALNDKRRALLHSKG